MTEDQKKLAKNEILKRAPNYKCPVCGNRHFQLTDGYLVDVLQVNDTSHAISGEAIPSVGMICNNCGLISQHALGILGLLSNPSKKAADESK